jgi:1-deoxyxylulose-5-phosphate synthase
MDAVVGRTVLGTSRIEISRVVLGCGNIGGIGSPPATRGHGNTPEEGYALIDHAVGLGVTVLDTANSYAGGVSERVVGRWVADHPESGVLVATKVGNLAEEGQTSIDLSPEHINRQVGASLARLGRIDLYLAHAPDHDTPVEATLEAFAALVERGDIAAYGACNVSLEQMRQTVVAAERLGITGYSWVQNEYNLLARGDEAGLLPFLADHGLGFTPFSPLAAGVLAGRYRSGEPPPPGSRKAVLSEIVRDVDEEMSPGLARLALHAAERGVSMAGLALAWVLSAPGVSAALVAPRDRAQFAAVEEALGVGLDRAEWALVGSYLSVPARI